MDELQRQEEILFGDVLARIVEGWRLLLGGAILASIVLGIAGLLVEPMYRARTVLAFRDVDGDVDALESAAGRLGGLAALTGFALPRGDARAEVLAVFRSRRFTDRFIRDANLLPVLFSDRWDAQKGQWKPGAAPPSTAEAFLRVDRDVRRIVENNRTGLVSVEVDWSDPVVAARWANSLVSQLNADMRAKAIEDAEDSREFLEEELSATKILEVRSSINNLIEIQIKRRMLASVNQDYAFRVIDPAVPPAATDTITASPLLLALLGFFAGGLLSAVVVLAIHPGSARRSGAAYSRDVSASPGSKS